MKNTSPSNENRSKRYDIETGASKAGIRTKLAIPRRALAEIPVAAALMLSLFSFAAAADEQGHRVAVFKAADVKSAAKPIAGEAVEISRSIPGLLPFDAQALAAAKAAAGTGRFAAENAPMSLASTAVPKVIKGFDGIRDAHVSPPDPSSAVGKSRYIELTNAGFRITDKNATLRGFGTLANLFGWQEKTDTFTPNIMHPQIIWDPSKNRFFITGDIVITGAHPDPQHYLAYVFSKTDSPSTAADFCQYALGPFPHFPDDPQLGDTNDAVLIGVNTFESKEVETFLESDIFSISKPPAGTACPDPAKFAAHILGPLETADSRTAKADPPFSIELAFNPVPANQLDSSPRGWVVGTQGQIPAAELELWKITTTASGDVTIGSMKGKKIPVPAYTVPQNAPQPGTVSEIRTLDARLRQTVSAINPARGSKVSLWAQHTVSRNVPLPPTYWPPSGAEVRWYEIDPTTATLFSRGKLSSTARFYFNAAISPNRAVNGASKKFGDTMVLQANVTSTGILPTINSQGEPNPEANAAYMPQLYPSIVAVSKKGNNPQSAVTMVKPGTQILDDFTCAAVCLWGQYAGLTPDPTPPASAKQGLLWGNNELGGGASNANASAPWQTWNFILAP